MKTMMNFTTSPDDTDRYENSEELRQFYQQFGCAGLELMPLGNEDNTLITPDMVVGVHACCYTDWIGLDRNMLLTHYRSNLNYAESVGAEYVVFHVTQVTMEESMTYELLHTDVEIIDAVSDFINELLDGQAYSFCFLMENLWWPGLTMRDPAMTERLLNRVHYPNKGLMLDTGHFMNSNRDLRTPQDALAYLHEMLDRHEKLLPMIKGVHLQQSLSGAYVSSYLKNPDPVETDPDKRFAQMFEHIFKIDQHRPFAADGVKELVDRIAPDYVTYEYITTSREEHAQFLEAGSKFFR